MQCTLAEIKKMSLRRFAYLSRILGQLASSAMLLHELVCVLQGLLKKFADPNYGDRFGPSQ